MSRVYLYLSKPLAWLFSTFFPRCLWSSSVPMCGGNKPCRLKVSRSCSVKTVPLLSRGLFSRLKPESFVLMGEMLIGRLHSSFVLAHGKKATLRHRAFQCVSLRMTRL